MRVLIVIVSLCASSDPAPTNSPYLRPEFSRLMEAVTFHLSFDHDTMTPDMAEGEKHAPQILTRRDAGAKGPQFAPGLIGRALVLGTGRALYPRAGNWLLEKRGAVALWVRPEQWQRPNDRNVTLLMTGNATFYLQRQGPLLGENNLPRRHEAIQYLVANENRRLTGAGGHPPLENGRWYLLVANWSWPTFALSVDGQAFAANALTAAPKDDFFGPIVVGDIGDGARGLLDEVMMFRRPLTIEEVKLLWCLRE